MKLNTMRGPRSLVGPPRGQLARAELPENLQRACYLRTELRVEKIRLEGWQVDDVVRSLYEVHVTRPHRPRAPAQGCVRARDARGHRNRGLRGRGRQTTRRSA